MNKKPSPSAVRTNWPAIWALIKPYWISDQKWRARALLLAIIALNLGMVYINVRLNDWNRQLYDVLQSRNFDLFKSLLWQFTYLAFIYVAVAIYSVYLTQALQIRWRYWLTDRYMDKWLAHRAYYRIEQGREGRLSDNPDQRIAEDLHSLTGDTLALVLGFISSAVTLASFVHILWAISGPIGFSLFHQSWQIPGYMVWCAVAYALVGSGMVWWIGKPLVGLNFNQERFEANFRFGLIRVREHAEAVALYRGEVQEKMQLQARMDDIRDNWWNIMRVTKKLNIGVNFYGQAANIFPLLVSAPRYFSGAITLGVLMQISNAFGQVQDALSWFINSFTTLASWKASINRLAGFNADVQRMQNLPTNIRVRVQKPVHHQSPDAAAQQGLQIEHLNLNLPDGRALLKDFNARIERGQHILISGPSGCGKSTLVRAIADIWPYGEGRIALPADAGVMFLPQRSYLPIGTLRAALSYPAAEGAFSDEQIASCLELCRLPHLQQAIGETANWSQHLSPGEQQRLAFVRVFLNRPDILFLDEASSAMDGETEEALYTLLPQQLPGVTVVSIAHRETLARFHRQRWHFSRSSGASALRDEEGFRVEVSGLRAGPV